MLLNYDWIADTDQPPIHRYTLFLSERQRQYETDLWRQTLERSATRLFELTRYLTTSLDESQKGRVLSPSGLPLSEMTPQQQAAFVQMLFVIHGQEILDVVA